MRKLLPIIVLSTLFVSCAQEVLEPEQQISGMFALDDGSCLVRAYLSFENGRLSQYSATTPYPFVEGKIWHTDSRAFQLANKQNYSIRDGVLTASDGVSGPAELKDGVLTIGNKRYVALEGFEEAPYSRIVAENEYVFTYTEQDISIPFTVENPLPGKELKVSLSSSASGGTWITNLAVQEGKITAHLSATAEDRTGIIELSYTHAESVTVQIKQQPSTFITIPETSRTVDYTSSTQTLNYTIENPVATSSLTATSSAAWINNIQVSNGQISFAVQENNSGADRNATLTLRYEGARDATFTILQRWSASSITLSPSSKEVDYTGGSFTFNYTIVNPREGISVAATSQSNWITNVQISGSTVSYKVSENNSGAQRTGKIKLTYGSYASAEFIVTQSWTASSITMTSFSQTTDYTGGSFSFSYAVSNPREGVTVTATSQANWIIDVKQTGTTVSYKVAENNSGSQRTGKIKLTYGNYATAEFTVTQSWSASGFTLTPVSQTVNYAGGTFNFSYSVNNPREGITVTATSQASWITDVKQNGTTVSYKVAENNSAFQRCGKIQLTYSDYVSTVFDVMQAGKPVVSLTLNKSELALLTGASETLITIVDPSDAPLRWSSNNNSVATVDQNGKVSAVGNGTATITVSAENGKNATCSILVTTAVTGVSLSDSSIRLDPGANKTLKATITPSTASNKTVSWSSSDTSIATVDQNGKVSAVTEGVSIITVTTVDGEKTASCKVTVIELLVDLGLSVKWASCNLGASSPEEFGDYYAWGETKTKSEYSWDTYAWGNDRTGITKYTPTDGGKTLAISDDAARKVLGGGWRIPTYDQFTELVQNCQKEWTRYNGVDGYKFTSKTNSEKWIFLPAAGIRKERTISSKGTRGFYWSSSWKGYYVSEVTEGCYAYSLNFYDSSVFTSTDVRYKGLSIRPVTY